MITTHIRPGRKPYVLAVFSFRHDAHLVPEMLVNIAPFVDGWVSYDDRASDAVFSNEVERRVALLNAARNAGAIWALAIDPDERFEAALADEIEALTSRSDCNVVTFALREMYTPTDYRIDGVWGQKRQARLLRIADGVVTPEGDLHLPWTAFIPDARVHNSDFNLYHLKMIAPARRKARANLYAQLDPDRRMQEMGYDYLADEDGAVFDTIGPDRFYLPAHEDDGGLWMSPSQQALAQCPPNGLQVLILTNHFADLAGSEVVALEIAEWFRDRGDAVTLGANFIGDPIQREAAGITLVDEVETLQIEQFDLVWCQHDLLTHFPVSELERAADIWMPHIAFASLSPFEPYEHLNLPLARAVSAEIFANSPETRSEMVRRHAGELTEDEVRVFYNAAPAAFHLARRAGSARRLAHVTLVSNHPPPEILDALDLIAGHGIEVRRIGQGRDWRRVTPAELAQTDAIVTIGKTVVYGIALGIPAYVYDHLGGDGWLTPGCMLDQLAHNFSGRPGKRRLTASQIANELLDGYQAAAALAADPAVWPDPSQFRLDIHLDALRQRALSGSSTEKSGRLKQSLADPGTRSAFEAMHRKALVMKRSYRLAYS